MQNELSAWAQGKIEGEKAIDLINEIWWVGSLEGYWSQRGRLAADAAMVALAHSEWVFCLCLFGLDLILVMLSFPCLSPSVLGLRESGRIRRRCGTGMSWGRIASMFER